LLLSPWLGAVAAQTTVLAVTFSLGGRRLVRSLLFAWLLLFLAIPLPGPLDGRLIAALQWLTSIGASNVLEVLGVLHVRTGNLLDLGGHSILVEEACSGVHSLYSVLACTLFWSAWARRSVNHALVLLLAAFAWVLAGNVARIVAVATLDGVGGVNLSSGWGHEALGICLFAIMLGLIWSTDHLLLLPTPLSPIPWRQIWFNLTTNPVEQQDGNPEEQQVDNHVEPPDGNIGEQQVGDLNESTLRAQPSAVGEGYEPTRLPPLSATALSAWPIVVCYGLLAVAQAGTLSAQIRGFSLASVGPVALPADTVQALETLEENSLPQEFGTWKRASFEVNQNSIDHPIGRNSRTWLYVSGEQLAAAAIFYPYPDWKEVIDCYEALGWTVQNRVVQNADPAGETGPYVMARLYQPWKKTYGYLLFQNRDASGRPLTPPVLKFSDFIRTRLAENQSWQTLTGVAPAPNATPTYLVQFLLESPEALDPIEEEEAEALFQQVLQVLPK
jgi:exosortase